VGFPGRKVPERWQRITKSFLAAAQNQLSVAKTPLNCGSSNVDNLSFPHNWLISVHNTDTPSLISECFFSSRFRFTLNSLFSISQNSRTRSCTGFAKDAKSVSATQLPSRKRLTSLFPPCASLFQSSQKTSKDRDDPQFGSSSVAYNTMVEHPWLLVKKKIDQIL